MAKLLRFDWAIKHLLRDKANFDILEGFYPSYCAQMSSLKAYSESEGNKEDQRQVQSRGFISQNP